ncbi:hypothetical protein [Natronococcus jeotgali]|uniref:Transposase (TCE33) n=1 Tax=Natronococcus jeotgali DSM 18795 TaxID=1227498 RepID=L9XMT9_9EURY|nr:transposase (TCE33) [Natronococcus jeotgali DSM 18795]
MRILFKPQDDEPSALELKVADILRAREHASLIFVFACLVYLIWRTVDLLVQIELTGEYGQAPLITAENTLTLLKKETGIGGKVTLPERKSCFWVATPEGSLRKSPNSLFN